MAASWTASWAAKVLEEECTWATQRSAVCVDRAGIVGTRDVDDPAWKKGVNVGAILTRFWSRNSCVYCSCECASAAWTIGCLCSPLEKKKKEERDLDRHHACMLSPPKKNKQNKKTKKYDTILPNVMHGNGRKGRVALKNDGKASKKSFFLLPGCNLAHADECLSVNFACLLASPLVHSKTREEVLPLGADKVPSDCLKVHVTEKGWSLFKSVADINCHLVVGGIKGHTLHCGMVINKGSVIREFYPVHHGLKLS